jgi:hypothetical protein
METGDTPLLFQTAQLLIFIESQIFLSFFFFFLFLSNLLEPLAERHVMVRVLVITAVAGLGVDAGARIDPCLHSEYERG